MWTSKSSFLDCLHSDFDRQSLAWLQSISQVDVYMRKVASIIAVLTVPTQSRTAMTMSSSMVVIGLGELGAEVVKSLATHPQRCNTQLAVPASIQETRTPTKARRLES